MTSWQQLGAESAARENERMRQQGEAHRQKVANDALAEMVSILNSIDARLNRVENLIAEVTPVNKVTTEVDADAYMEAYTLFYGSEING